MCLESIRFVGMTTPAKTYFELQLNRLICEYYLPDHYYVQIRHSKLFMERHFSEKIELKQIAATAFMSRFHYIRMFKRIYGLSPRQFLKDLRLNKGKELLKNGFNIYDVCFAVGYDSLPTFCKVFKKATGYSPKAYQDLNKSNPG